MGQASADLRRAVQDWMASHKVQCGEDGLTPKSHWAFDIADQLAEDPVVVDTFAIERLHLRVKAAAEHIKHLDGYEESVLSRVVNDQARAAQSMSTTGLAGHTAPFPRLPSATVSDRLEAEGVHVHIGDIVMRGEEVAKVVACAAEQGDLFVVCDPLALTITSSPNSGTWTFRGTRCLWRAADLRQVLAWKDLPGGQILSLIHI